MSVAIVIPSYNRPAKVRACLACLEKLDGGPYRTIVVDDGGEVPLAPVVAEFGTHVSCLRLENSGPGAARNAGARAAEGAEFLCFIDDDCFARPDWAMHLLSAQGGVEKRLVGGRVENALSENVYSSASQSLSSFLYEFYQSNGSDMNFFTTNNMCCRRADFLAIGGFDSSFSTASEDRDLSLRWKDWGGTLTYAEGAVIDHAHDLTFRSFWRQHANYGRGARKLHLTMDGRGDARPKIESLAFYLGMVSYPVRRRLRGGTAQAVLVGLSQVAMVAGYLEAIRNDRRGRRTT